MHTTSPTFTTVVDKATRLTNSASGNPRWRVDTARGRFLTASDDAPAAIDWTGLAGRQVRLWLDLDGRIAQVDPIGAADIIATVERGGVFACSECDEVHADSDDGGAR